MHRPINSVELLHVICPKQGRGFPATLQHQSCGFSASLYYVQIWSCSVLPPKIVMHDDAFNVIL